MQLKARLFSHVMPFTLFFSHVTHLLPIIGPFKPLIPIIKKIVNKISYLSSTLFSKGIQNIVPIPLSVK